jgi:membrane-associated phospholipid phosphatase
LTVPEWMIVVYLAYLLVLLPCRPIPVAGRVTILVFVPCLIGLVLLAPGVPDSMAWRFIRTWLPLPFVLACYWLTGCYFVNPQERFEQRFAAYDARVRRWLGASDFARTAPRALLEFLEAAYFSCYVVLPAGLMTLIVAGRQDLSVRFWSIVLLAELGCYGVLPWIRTRPSWVLHPDSPLSSRRVLTRVLNLRVVREASTRANTFPSGHAAGALATALAVLPVWPAAGAVFLFVAVSIMAGSVFGEYHYAGDAITGALAAVAAFALVTLIGV